VGDAGLLFVDSGLLRIPERRGRVVVDLDDKQHEVLEVVALAVFLPRAALVRSSEAVERLHKAQDAVGQVHSDEVVLAREQREQLHGAGADVDLGFRASGFEFRVSDLGFGV